MLNQAILNMVCEFLNCDTTFKERDTFVYMSGTCVVF